MSGLPESIRAAFVEAGGRLTFARFMELALADPQSGYYTAPGRRVGSEGDFTTAPRRVPAFNQALARLLAGLADSLSEAGWGDEFTLVEVGPGEGDLAHGILSTWEAERPDLKARASCRLVEVGEGLRARQEETLAEFLNRGWEVAWSNGIAEGQRPAGLVVSNELLDALPIHRLRVTGGELREAWVALRGEPDAGTELVELWEEVSFAAQEELGRLFGTTAAAELRSLSRDGEIELRPAVVDYLRQVAGAFEAVCLVTVDYGEWLAGSHQTGDDGLCSPSRPGPAFAGEGEGESEPRAILHGRSLRSYFRHQRGSDPYQAVGRQDLTSDVDFRALALHGREEGFDCLLYAPLAGLLGSLALPEEQLAASLQDEQEYSLDRDMEQGPLRALLDEDDLGGLFKVMVQAREKELNGQ